MALAESIRFYRERAGLYQSDLGRMLGVSAQAVSKWERGKSEPDSTCIMKMCQLFECTVNDLFGSDYSKKPAPSSGMRESVKRLFDEISEAGLSDEEAEYIRSLVSGVKALRKP